MPPSFESLKRVTIFHGGWIAAVFVLPGLLLYSYLTGDVARPLYSLAGYYALTALFPPQRWWWWVESMSYMAAPYFKRQRVVFDNGSDLAEQPRASKLKSPPVTPLRNRRKPSGNSKTDNSKGNDSANDNKGTGLASLFPWLPAPFNPDPPPPQACSAAAAMGLPPPRSKVLVALAPHGIMSFGLTCLMSAPEIRHSSLVGLVADAITNLPIIREMLGWSGISSCSKKSMTQLMEKGENLIIIPGGFQEATHYKRGRHCAVLQDKKGFVSMALKHGYDLIPCYVFGEEETFWNIQPLPSALCSLLNRWNVPTAFFWGSGILPFYPDSSAEITIVLGSPLRCPALRRAGSPQPNEVESYHRKFVAALQDLFDRNKEKYAKTGRAAKLEVL